MPFVSMKDQRQSDSLVKFQEEYTPESDFGEVFAASVGQVFDEELSISNTLNREGNSARRQVVEDLISSGQLDRNKYVNRRGVFNYDKAALDFEQIKTNKQLDEERKELLKLKRDYASDVMSRGSGAAQFLGAATGYLLDPVSVATMPIGFATGASRGLAAAGKAAIKAGATEMAIETGIQAFVYEHKHDIDSPYQWKDALTNIASAATASALLAGGAVGIREYVRSVRAKTKDLPMDDDIAFSNETLSRMEDTLSSNHLRKEGMTSEQLIQADMEYLEGLEMRRIAKPKIEIDPQVIRKPASDPGLFGKEKSVLSKTGLADDYAVDMLEYKKRFGSTSPEAPNLKGIMIDEQVKVRETGEVVTVKSEADVMLRRAEKRLSQIQKLRGCLGA